MTRFHEEIDVAVVGSGAAGLSAAIEAREAGASAIVFEKRRVTGGNTRLADGGLAGAGNFLQKARGVADSPERFFEDMRTAGLGLNHPRLAMRVAGEAAGAIDWTRSRLGVEYLDRLDRFGGHSAARCLTIRKFSGRDLVKALVAAAGNVGAEIRTRAALRGFRIGADGAVTGIDLAVGGNPRTGLPGEPRAVRVRRGVVLAAGGYGEDVRFRSLQNPLLDERVGTTNHPGATAEALIAALEIRAAPVHLSWIQTGPWSCADEPGYGVGARFASYGVYIAGILVDPASGQRIVDEWADRRTRSDAIFRTGHPCVGIADARAAEAEAETHRQAVAKGKVRVFDALPDLARAHGMDPERLEATVARYNRQAAAGERDEFGKALDRGAKPLDRPPFSAIRLWPKVHYTPGGVAIDERARVLDLHGKPIPGLFAAGEVCGGIHGAGRLGSVALPECLVFGRIAGRSAAARTGP